MYLNDTVRLRHMLDAAKEIMAFVEKTSRDELDTDRMRVLALVKNLEIIGEAAANISRDFQRKHTDIPWAAIVGMRNRLIHGYFDIDFDRVWDTVTYDLPPLITATEELLA